MSYDIRSIQRLFSATHRTHVVSCAALTACGGSKRVRHQRCVGCESSSGSAVEPGLEGGERKGQGQPCFGGGEVRLPQAVVRLRRAGDGVPNGNRDRSAGARDRGRRSEHVTTVIASVGRGDAGICSHRGIVVGQSVVASVAIGDGADGEPTHSPAVLHAGQRLSAFAAREREVRAAIFGRVSRCRPDIGGNKVRRRVQSRAGIHHTSRTGADARFGSRWCSLPQRATAVAHVPLSSGMRRTCFLNAGVHDEDDGFQCDGAAFTHFRERRHGRRTCYRGVSRTVVSAKTGGASAAGRAVACIDRRCAAKPRPAWLSARCEDVVQRGMPAQRARTPPARSAAAPAIEPHAGSRHGCRQSSTEADAMPRRERSVPYRAVGPSDSGAGANSDPSAQGGARAGRRRSRHRRGGWLWREGRTRHSEVEMAMAIALAGAPSPSSSSSQDRSRAPLGPQ